MKALRGDAYLIAIDIGRAALMADDGIPKLVAALLLNAFPQQKSEAKELYRAGHAEQGLLRDNAERVSTPSCRGDADGGSS